MKKEIDASFFGTENVGKILLKIAPPVMLTQLIQALYNIVDSFFVGRYSGAGLTALSIIFPVQFVITALALGTGVGVNTYMAGQYAVGHRQNARDAAGTGTLLAFLTWAVFSFCILFLLKPYIAISSASRESAAASMEYGMIVCIGSLAVFLESVWTQIHQAGGDMKLPMLAQVAGTIVNVIFDPLLIFGCGMIPEMGIRGAALATVAGQCVAALFTLPGGLYRIPDLCGIKKYAGHIYSLGWPQILMRLTMTVYIVILNIILAGFSDEAVTTLGLYYKMQTFFFIPLLSLNTCIVPVISYNLARGSYKRIEEIMRTSILISAAFMLVGIFCFECLPRPIIGLFSDSPKVFEIAVPAFRIIGTSFLSAVFSLIFPVFFQAVGKGRPSILLSLTRQIFCLIPIFWLLSKLGVMYVWFAFPASETIAGIIGLILYLRQKKSWQ